MCGICAVSGKDAYLVSRALLTRLNHRGQEGTGLFIHPAEDNIIKGHGLVNEVLKIDNERKSLILTVGQVRYPTQGTLIPENIQPIIKTIDNVKYVIAHNGEIVGSNDLIIKWNLEKEIPNHFSDTHIIPYSIARAPGENLEDKIINGLSNLNPSWSLCMAIQEEDKNPLLIFAKDPYGIRPLSLVKNHQGIYALSENSLPSKNGQEIRELEGGEIIFVEEGQIKKIHKIEQKRGSPCIFELIYFHFPVGEFSGLDIPSVRDRLGRQLAIEDSKDNSIIKDSIVVYAPDSSHVAAVGYSSQANLPLKPGIVRRHYQSNPRGFMAKPEKRAALLESKYEVIKQYIEGKKVTLIDDSIVRGNASKYLVELLRKNSASEVHVRIPSSRIEHPCIYGIDMKSYPELIAHKMSTDEIRKYIGANSLSYLSIEGMLNAIGLPKEKSCNACFTGNYPFK